jgi:mRNA interferase MazF
VAEDGSIVLSSARRNFQLRDPREYYRRSGLGLVYPVTNQKKDYPFEVSVPEGCAVGGVILSDHVKSVDFKARRTAKAGRAPASASVES